MSLYNNSFSRAYDFLFVELADPRTNDWFLIRHPTPGLTIIGAYLYFVLSWGPRYMKHRKPMELTNILIVYNFLQVLISTWIVWEGLTGAWLFHYSWKCEPVDWSWSPHALRVARGVYIYFLAKMSELLDTIFFVLRKKDRQITFLHMYHHTTQFCIAFLHSAQLLFHDCGFPRFSLYFTLPNAIFFYYLFYDFYNKAYPIAQEDKTQIENGHAVAASNGKVVPVEPCNGTAIATEDSNHRSPVASTVNNTKQTKKDS
ncbi:stuck in traffic [Carabus blaptoides fortunei]